VPEPDLYDIPDDDDDDENDDTYINDGHVAPVNTLGQGEEDEFLHNCDPICINAIFVSIWYLICKLWFNLVSALRLNYDFT
jgi:hypothetical protein